MKWYVLPQRVVLEEEGKGGRAGSKSNPETLLSLVSVGSCVQHILAHSYQGMKWHVFPSEGGVGEGGKGRRRNSFQVQPSTAVISQWDTVYSIFQGTATKE